MDCISMFVHIMKENDSRVTLSKERLNLKSDRQQFHEYLQNEQIIEHTHTHTHTRTHARTHARTHTSNHYIIWRWRYGSWFGTPTNHK